MYVAVNGGRVHAHFSSSLYASLFRVLHEAVVNRLPSLLRERLWLSFLPWPAMGIVTLYGRLRRPHLIMARLHSPSTKSHMTFYSYPDAPHAGDRRDRVKWLSLAVSCCNGMAKATVINMYQMGATSRVSAAA